MRGDILHALILDGLIPTTVDARVTFGFLTLTGTASWQYQRDEAKFIVANVPGVFGIEDRIKLITAPDGHDIKNNIGGAFARSARLDADGRPSWSAAVWSIHPGAVNSQQHDDADPLAAATEEGEAGR